MQLSGCFGMPSAYIAMGVTNTIKTTFEMFLRCFAEQLLLDRHKKKVYKVLKNIWLVSKKVLLLQPV